MKSLSMRSPRLHIDIKGPERMQTVGERKQAKTTLSHCLVLRGSREKPGSPCAGLPSSDFSPYIQVVSRWLSLSNTGTETTPLLWHRLKWLTNNSPDGIKELNSSGFSSSMCSAGPGKDLAFSWTTVLAFTLLNFWNRAFFFPVSSLVTFSLRHPKD